jgi:hypothetical protein
MEIEFTDRYGGGPGPDVDTMCEGQCEGLGCYPVQLDAHDLTDYEKQAVQEAASKGPTDDGYYFIKCGDCNGTGKR